MKRGSCDCCDKQNVLVGFVLVIGIETWACAECSGEDPQEREAQYADDNGQFGVGA